MINNAKYIDNQFSNCKSLMSIPDISKWNKIKDIKNKKCCFPKIT